MTAKKAFVGLHQHVENRIADAENVVFRFSHQEYPATKNSREGAATYHVPPTASKRGCYRWSMIRPILTVSTGTLASRLLGFARDAMMAALLGAGPVADAFLVAFQLVNVVRRLLTEGALNAALVPAWLRVREADGAVAAAAFAGRVLGTVSAR